jgi:hypothetical protein
MPYLLKIKGKRIDVPTPKNLKDGEVVEVTINRVFVDKAVEKMIVCKACVGFR